MSLTRDTETTFTLARVISTQLTRLDDDGHTLIERIRDAMNGQPRAACYDTDRVAGHTSSDPTATAALTHDPAAQDLRNLQHQMTQARRALEHAIAILHAYTPRPPTEHERQRMATVNEPHCESCARVEVAKGIPRWEPPLTQEKTTVSEHLVEPVWLCRWCYDHVAQTGAKPSTDEVEQHHSGQRIRCTHKQLPEKVASSPHT
jgi:hypothetical protein